MQILELDVYLALVDHCQYLLLPVPKDFLPKSTFSEQSNGILSSGRKIFTKVDGTEHGLVKIGSTFRYTVARVKFLKLTSANNEGAFVLMPTSVWKSNLDNEDAVSHAQSLRFLFSDSPHLWEVPQDYDFETGDIVDIHYDHVQRIYSMFKDGQLLVSAVNPNPEQYDIIVELETEGDSVELISRTDV